MIKNKNNYILLIASLILIIFSVCLWFSRPLESRTLNVKFIIDKNIGVDLNSSELNFGKIPKGGTAVRRVVIENNYKSPIKIKILVSRGISERVFIDKEYILLSEEKVFIPVTLKIPENISFGNYSGQIKFEFRML